MGCKGLKRSGRSQGVEGVVVDWDIIFRHNLET